MTVVCHSGREEKVWMDLCILGCPYTSCFVCSSREKTKTSEAQNENAPFLSNTDSSACLLFRYKIHADKEREREGCLSTTYLYV